MCQIDDHSGKETRFRKPQEEPCGIELADGVHEASDDRDYSPGDHDPGDPFPRAPAFDDDGSRYFEQNIGQVKHAYAQTVHLIAEAQVGAHSKVGERNVDAIDIVHDIDQEHERKQPPGNSPSCSNTNLW